MKIQRFTESIRDLEPVEVEEDPAETIRRDQSRPASMGRRPGAVAQSPYAKSDN
jgi:hypothetical protein